jgi:SAM-dependent methyltransferase
MVREIDSYFSDAHWAQPLSDFERFRLQETAAHLPEDLGDMLDVGCGDGRLLRTLEARGYSGTLTGCDGSHAGLARAGVPGVRCDVGALPFADGSFDGVACCEVMEHLPDDVLRSLVSELQRVARSYVYITVPYDEDLAQGLVLCHGCGHRFHVHGHRHSFRPEDIAGLFPDWTPRRLGVFGVGSRRRYRPWILRMKQSVFDCWAWACDLDCPECGTPVDPESKKLVRNALGGLNVLLTPGKTAGGWVYALFERKAGGGA